MILHIYRKYISKGENLMSKKLFLAALAIVLSAGCSMATDITGITGQNGVYNINPEHFSGNAGYRKYDNFILDHGDVANLNFVRPNGNNPSVFVNLVGRNGVNIDGIVNTTRNGNFYNGHAVFITPGAFTLGRHGILNVGSLSIATPKENVYDNMINGYGSANFDYAGKIGQKISKLTQNSDGSAGAANIFLSEGKIFARNGVEMTGKEVNAYASIINGIKSNHDQVFTDEEPAYALFRTLVNTNGIDSAHFKPASQSGRVLIKSEDKLIQFGKIINPGDIYLTNKGSGGMRVVEGDLASNNLVQLYNQKGDMKVGNYSEAWEYENIDAKKVAIINKGGNLTLDVPAAIKADTINVKNQGTGHLAVKGSLNANGQLSVKNETGSGMTIDSNAQIKNTGGETAIKNSRGEMLINFSNIDTKGKLGIVNNGSGLTIGKYAQIKNDGTEMKISNTGSNGLTVIGKINNTGNLQILNDKGKLTLGTDSTGNTAAQVLNKNGTLSVISRGASTGLVQSSAATLQNTNGKLFIRNKGTGVATEDRGLDLQGTVKNIGGGITAINNERGNMYIGGNVQSNGNLGIINRAGANKMMLASDGSITGKNINIKNNGAGDMTVNSTINNSGRVNVIANRGTMHLGGTVHNNSGALSSNGGFYAATRRNATGLHVTSGFNADGNGEILIKNIAGTDGLNYNGNINTTNHQAALVNRRGDMAVAGSIKTTDAPVVISSKGNQLVIKSTANINSGSLGNLYNDTPVSPIINQNATIHNMEGHGSLLGQYWE